MLPATRRRGCGRGRARRRWGTSLWKYHSAGVLSLLTLRSQGAPFPGDDGGTGQHCRTRFAGRGHYRRLARTLAARRLTRWHCHFSLSPFSVTLPFSSLPLAICLSAYLPICLYLSYASLFLPVYSFLFSVS